MFLTDVSVLYHKVCTKQTNLSLQSGIKLDYIPINQYLYESFPDTKVKGGIYYQKVHFT